MKKLLLITALFIAGSAGMSSVTNAQGIAVNGNGAAPHSSAALDVSSTTQGVLISRMTTAERDAIVSPAPALQIYNTTTNCFEFYAFNTWQTLGCAVDYSIGASHQGGVIGYIFEPGDDGYVEGEVHGIIAAPSDQ